MSKIETPVKPTTELTRAGNHLVLYTNDDGLYRQLREWKQLIKIIPYYQNKTLVGRDLYFELKAKAKLLRALEGTQFTSEV